ncbi:unnamed protein product, partial [Laminaria digitata]
PLLATTPLLGYPRGCSTMLLTVAVGRGQTRLQHVLTGGVVGATDTRQLDALRLENFPNCLFLMSNQIVLLCPKCPENTGVLQNILGRMREYEFCTYVRSLANQMN